MLRRRCKVRTRPLAGKPDMDATHAYARDSAGIVHTATEVRPAKKREAEGARVACGSRSTNTHAWRHGSSRATRAAQSLPRPTMATARRTHPNPLPAPEICGPLSQPSPSASSQQLPRPDQQTRPVRPETTSGVLREHAWSVFRAAGRGWARSRAGGACWSSRLDGRRAGSMVAGLPVQRCTLCSAVDRRVVRG